MFREKLRTMGKSSKAKFTKLATMFSRRAPNMGGAGRMLGQAPAPSKDNLLLNAEPLVNCRDSDEESEGEEKHKTTKVIAREKLILHHQSCVNSHLHNANIQFWFAGQEIPIDVIWERPELCLSSDLNLRHLQRPSKFKEIATFLHSFIWIYVNLAQMFNIYVCNLFMGSY